MSRTVSLAKLAITAALVGAAAACAANSGSSTPSGGAGGSAGAGPGGIGGAGGAIDLDAAPPDGPPDVAAIVASLQAYGTETLGPPPGM